MVVNIWLGISCQNEHGFVYVHVCTLMKPANTVLFVVLFMGISQNATWVCVCACTMCCWVYYHSPHAELSDQGWVALYAACWDSASVRMKHLHSFYLFSALTLSKFWWLELFYLCRFFFFFVGVGVWHAHVCICAWIFMSELSVCLWYCQYACCWGQFFFYLLPAHSNI